MGKGKIGGSRNQKQEPEQPTYKPEKYTPPPPPPGNEEAWELQFCKWWGWNWVQKDNLYPDRFPQQPDDRPMSKTTCDYYHQVRPPPLPTATPMQQMYPQRRLDRNTNCFKDLCNCIFSTNRQRATESLQRLYSTPSNSIIYQQAFGTGNKDGCFDSFSCLEMRNNPSRSADKNHRIRRMKSVERPKCRCPPKSQDREPEMIQRNCCKCKPPFKSQDREPEIMQRNCCKCKPPKTYIKDQCTCEQPKECGCISNTSTLSEETEQCCGCSKKKPSDQSCKCKNRNPKRPTKIDCPCQTKKPEMKCTHAQTAEPKPNKIKNPICECCCHCTCREVKGCEPLAKDSKETIICEYCREHCKEHAKKKKRKKSRVSSIPRISKYKLYPELRKKEEEEARQRLHEIHQEGKHDNRDEDEEEEEDEEEINKSDESAKSSERRKTSRPFAYYMFGESHPFKPSLTLLSKNQEAEPNQNHKSKEGIRIKPAIHTTNISSDKTKVFPNWNGIRYDKRTIEKSTNQINSPISLCLDPQRNFYASCQNIPYKNSDTDLSPNQNLHKDSLYQDTSNERHARFLPYQQNISFKNSSSCQDVYTENIPTILNYEPIHQYQHYSPNINEMIQKNKHSPYQQIPHSRLPRSNQDRSFKKPNMRESPDQNNVHISTSKSYVQQKDLAFIGEEPRKTYQNDSQSNWYQSRCKNPNKGELTNQNHLLFSTSQAFFHRKDCQIAANTDESPNPTYQFLPSQKDNPCNWYPPHPKTSPNVEECLKENSPISNNQPFTNDVSYINDQSNQTFSPCAACQLEEQNRSILCDQDQYYKKSPNPNIQSHQINQTHPGTSVKQVYSPTLKLSQCKCFYQNQGTKEGPNYDFQCNNDTFYKPPYIEGMFKKPSSSTTCRCSQCSHNCPIHQLSMHCFKKPSASYEQMENRNCPFCPHSLDLHPQHFYTKRPFEKYVQVPDRTPYQNLKKQKNFTKPRNYPWIQTARSEILDKRYKLNDEFSSPVSGKIYKLSTQTPFTSNDYKSTTLPDPIEVEEDIKYLENLEQRVKEELKSRVLLDVVCDAILFKNNGRAFETETDTLLSKYSTSRGSDIRDLYKNDLKREPDTNNAENLRFENHFMKKVEAVVKKIIKKSETENNSSDSENNFKIIKGKNKHKRSGSPVKTEPVKRFKHVDVNCPSSEESLVTQVNNFNNLFEKMDKIAKESSINVAKIQGVIRSLPRPNFGFNPKVTFENNQTNSEMMDKLYEVVINTVADETVIQNIFDIISNKNTEKEQSLKKRSDTNLSTICETSGSVQQKICDEFSETWSTVSSRSQTSEEKKPCSSIPRFKRYQKIDNKENRREKSGKKSRSNKKSKSMIPVKK